MHEHDLKPQQPAGAFIALSIMAWVGAIGFFCFGEWMQGSALVAFALACTALFLVNA